MNQNRTFRIELRSNHPDWYAYNVVMTACGSDDVANTTSYFACQDCPVAIDGTAHPIPAGDPAKRCTSLLCGPCRRFELYLYVLPNRLPDENCIEHTPAIEARLKIFDDQHCLHEQSVTVNPWGGATLHLTWPPKK